MDLNMLVLMARTESTGTLNRKNDDRSFPCKRSKTWHRKKTFEDGMVKISSVIFKGGSKKMKAIYYPAIFHPEEIGYSVSVPDIEGCYTQGDDMAKAVEMAQGRDWPHGGRYEDLSVPLCALCYPCGKWRFYRSDPF